MIKDENTEIAQWYLVKRQDRYEVVEATGAQMEEEYAKGVRWLGAPLQSYETAQTLADKLNGDLI